MKMQIGFAHVLLVPNLSSVRWPTCCDGDVYTISHLRTAFLPFSFLITVQHGTSNHSANIPMEKYFVATLHQRAYASQTVTREIRILDDTKETFGLRK